MKIIQVVTENHTVYSERHDVPFCPVPEPTDLPDTPPEVLDFFRHELKNYDFEKPVIVVVMQLDGKPMTKMQATNFLCGFLRLNIANQLMIFALSSTKKTQELLHRRHPELRVLWHAGLVEVVEQAQTDRHTGQQGVQTCHRQHVSTLGPTGDRG
jgi:hypothetical protein